MGARIHGRTPHDLGRGRNLARRPDDSELRERLSGLPRERRELSAAAYCHYVSMAAIRRKLAPILEGEMNSATRAATLLFALTSAFACADEAKIRAEYEARERARSAKEQEARATLEKTVAERIRKELAALAEKKAAAEAAAGNKLRDALVRSPDSYIKVNDVKLELGSGSSTVVDSIAITNNSEFGIQDITVAFEWFDYRCVGSYMVAVKTQATAKGTLGPRATSVFSRAAGNLSLAPARPGLTPKATVTGVKLSP